MKCDVVVVGAGPAGSTAAKCLAENKIKTYLIEKEKFPRDKPCGGGLPIRVLNRFPYIEKFIDSISYGCYTYSPTFKYVLKFVRQRPFLANVLREDFDYKLVKISIEAGVHFKQGKSVRDVKVLSDKVVVTLDDRSKIEAKAVIGCDGIRSIVAEKTHISSKKSDICVSIVQEQRMEPEIIEKYFTDKRLISLFIKIQGIAGYGWIFPKKNHINIGVGQFESAANPISDKKNIKELYKKFIKILKEKNIIPKDFKIENIKGATLPIFPLDKTFGDRVLICGDAAGFINSITGEGIYYAMVSGELAADVIKDSFLKKDFSEEFLSKYQKLWMEDFGNDLKWLGRFNYQWGKKSERFVRLLSKDEIFAKLMIGILGGRISISKYKRKLIMRYIIASIKDIFV